MPCIDKMGNGMKGFPAYMGWYCGGGGGGGGGGEGSGGRER